MTTVIACVMDKGHVRPLNMDKLAKWKESHKQGQTFEMILNDDTSNALSPMGKKFFAIRDEYANINGYSKPYATVELKHLYGVVYPHDKPPQNRLVRLVEAYGELEWQLSIKDYSHEEMMALVSGSDHALMEASV